MGACVFIVSPVSTGVCSVFSLGTGYQCSVRPEPLLLLQVPGKRCWLAPWLGRLAWPSSPSMRRSLWRCLLAWGRRESETSLLRCWLLPQLGSLDICAEGVSGTTLNVTARTWSCDTREHRSSPHHVGFISFT